MIGILEAALTAILNTIMKSSKHLSAGPNPWNRHRDGWKSMGYWATAGVENPLHQHKKELPFGSCSLTCNSLQVRAAIPALPEMKNRSGKNRSHSGTCCPRALTPDPTKGIPLGNSAWRETGRKSQRWTGFKHTKQTAPAWGCVHLHITFQEENFTIPFLLLFHLHCTHLLVELCVPKLRIFPSCAFLQAQSSPPPQARKQQSWGMK